MELIHSINLASCFEPIQLYLWFTLLKVRSVDLKLILKDKNFARQLEAWFALSVRTDIPTSHQYSTY